MPENETASFSRWQSRHTPTPEIPTGPTEMEALRPLLRLRQLATEIQSALARNDLALVTQAAALLAPALEQCKTHAAALDMSAGEAAEIALQTQSLLNRCEAELREAMARIRQEMKRLRFGKQAVVNARKPRTAAGSRLDTRR